MHTEESPETVDGQDEQHALDSNLELVRDEDTLVLEEDGELCGGKGDIVNPDADPEPLEELSDIRGRQFEDVVSETILVHY